MPTRQEVVACARGWIGTPYRRQGSARGLACNCAGVVRGVSRELGMGDIDPTESMDGLLGIRPDGHRLRAVCEKYLKRIAKDDAGPGDILLMKQSSEQFPHHLAIIGENENGLTVIQAMAVAPRRVVENSLDVYARSQIVAAYRFREIN